MVGGRGEVKLLWSDGDGWTLSCSKSCSWKLGERQSFPPIPGRLQEILEDLGKLSSSHHGVQNHAETFSGSTLVDELQDFLCDGQSGRRAEGGQLLFILLLLLTLKTMTSDTLQVETRELAWLTN